MGEYVSAGRGVEGSCRDMGSELDGTWVKVSLPSVLSSFCSKRPKSSFQAGVVMVHGCG